MSTNALTYAEARKLWPQPVVRYTMTRQLSWATPSITTSNLSWALAKTKPTTYAEARKLCEAAKIS
jgi:predicted nucleic acid-binding protein